MKSHIIKLSILTILSLPHAAIGKTQVERLSSYSLQSSDTKVLNEVTKNFEIVSRKGDVFEVYVSQDKTKEFLKIAPQASLLKLDVNADLRARVNKQGGTIAGYHSWTDVQNYLNNLVATHPDIAKLETYGQSVNGNPLYALKLSDNVAVDEDEPELMITSATHGDELITVEVLIGIIDQLVEAYTTGNNERLKSFVLEREFYFLPVINPDGFRQQSRYANGVDPNREYPWPDRPNRNPNLAIANVMKFYNSRNFAGSIDIHASGGMIMFPWGYTYDSIAASDDAKFRNLASYMAEPNGYSNGDIASTIYIAPGSSADYYYWHNSGAAFAYEIGHSKAPPASQIPAMVRQISESTWRWVEFFN